MNATISMPNASNVFGFTRSFPCVALLGASVSRPCDSYVRRERRLVAQAPSSLRMTRVPSTALIVALALVVRLPSLFRQLFDPDEGAIATMAMVVSRGGVLYRDVIDRKPPG